MAWAPDPAKAKAAEDAQREAEEAINARLAARETAMLSPFERKLLGVLEDLRDAIKTPDTGPVLATLAPSTPMEVVDRIRHALPDGSVITGPNGPILSVAPLGAPRPTAHRLDSLLDAGPDAAGRALDVAAMAVAALLPDTPDLGYARRVAEAAIDAAMHEAVVAELDAHFETTPGQTEESAASAGADVAAPAERPKP